MYYNNMTPKQDVLHRYRQLREFKYTPLQALGELSVSYYRTPAYAQADVRVRNESSQAYVDALYESVRERAVAAGVYGAYWYNGNTSKVRQRLSEARAGVL